MRNPSVFARPALVGAILVAAAASVSAQTWNTAFSFYEYNISSSGYGQFRSTDRTLPLPFTVTRGDGTISGTVSLRYPDSLPPGPVNRVDSGDYLVFSSPVKVGVHVELDYAAMALAGEQRDESAYLRLEISSGYTLVENSPCILMQQLTVRTGAGNHFVGDLDCTFSRVISPGNRTGDPVVISNYIDFTVFAPGSACQICTTLANYHAFYRLLPNSEVTAIEPAALSNDGGLDTQDVVAKITGLNFEAGSTVSLGPDVTVSDVVVRSATEIGAKISVLLGAAEGPRNVTITKPGGATQVGGELFYVSSLGPGIEVNQGVPIECEASRPCVADHDTWVRVRLPCLGTGCATGKSSVTGRLHVFRQDGTAIPGSPFAPELAHITVRPAGTALDNFVRQWGTDALNFRFNASRSLPEGTYDFVFEIDPRHPSMAPTGDLYPLKNLVRELKQQVFRRSPSERSIHVLAVVDAGRNLDRVEPLPHVDFTRAAFPISRDRVTISLAPFREQYGPGLMETLERLALRAALEEIYNQPPGGGPPPFTTYAVMFTNSLGFQGGVSYCEEGYCPGRSSIVQWDRDNARAVLTHELGHHHGLGDTYINVDPPGGEDRVPVNPPCPPNLDGCPVESGHLDTILGNLSVQLPLNDPNFATFTKRDVMGNAARPQRWIDRRTWDHLYPRLMNVSAPHRAVLQERWLLVRGRVSTDDTVTFHPFVSYTGVETGPRVDAGPYRVELQDSSGNAVSAKAFPISFKLPHSSQTASSAPFQSTLLFPATATRVVVKKEGRELASRPISAGPPTVTVIAPNGGETIGAAATVNWTASDPDGDPLTFSVLYSPDGVRWSTLATELTGSSYAWTTDLSPGSRNARVMVVASDGVHSATDTSDGPFTVAGKAPLVTFTAPADGAAIPVGQPVTLSGFGYDFEDGELPGSSLSYASDRSGALGVGRSVTVANLPTGAHTITLRAVDREGAASNAQIQITIFSPAADLNVVPVVGSTPGSGGSFFKTAVQIHNPTSATIAGNFVYHPQGQSGSAGDPQSGYMLLPGQTAQYGDLLPELGQSGLGTVDLIATLGSAPTTVVRIFNDAGAAGTTGMTEELMRDEDALESGENGVLIAPPEPSRARFNIGVRSLGSGATIRFTVRDAAGTVRTTGSRFYPAVYFAQQTAESLVGIPLLANDTVTFEVDAGSAIVYGATTDNTTQDPSLQFARALSTRSDPRRTIAAVAAAPGVLDSLFRTTLQLHNPTAAPISGRLVFHPGGFSGTDSDPSLPYALAPGATTSYADILGALGRTGLGSLDVVATTGSVPLAVARVFNDGGVRGTTGFSVDAARPEDALQSGETGVLIAPADPAATRFNVGIRTFDAGASLSVTIKNRDGQVVRIFTKVYAPNYFEQQAGSTFLGAAPGPSETVTIRVDAGSAIVYGASTDNKTQDPAIQVARAVTP